MKKKNIFVLLLLLTISIVAFGSTFLYVKLNKAERNSDELLIMTSCNPVYIATLNVAGNTAGVRVQNLSQPTTGCLHDYTLTTEDMKNLNYADVLVINGGGMEGYLDDVIKAYPDLTIIDASTGLELLEADEHDEENSHYWLSVNEYLSCVNNISEGLSNLSPENASAFTDNAALFASELSDKLIPQVAEVNEILSGKSVGILHEAYGYIAMDIDCQISADMDLDEERQVSAGEVAELISDIQEHDVKIIFAEEDYGKSVGDLLEEQTGVKVVYLNTLIHGQYSADSYITEMSKNYSLISESLQTLED